MRKCNAVSKEISARGMQTPEQTRSCNVVRHKRLRPRDTEALPITVLHYATKAMPASKGKCAQDTESSAPPPSLSVTRPKSTTELLHQGGGLLFPRTKCRCHSTPSQMVTRRITSVCLPQQDFSQACPLKN